MDVRFSNVGGPKSESSEDSKSLPQPKFTKSTPTQKQNTQKQDDDFADVPF